MADGSRPQNARIRRLAAALRCAVRMMIASPANRHSEKTPNDFCIARGVSNGFRMADNEKADAATIPPKIK